MEEFDFKFARRQFTRIGFGLFGFLVAAFAVQIIAVVLVMILKPSLMYDDTFTLLIGFISTFLVGVPTGILIIRTGPKSVFYPVCKMGFKDLVQAFLVMYGITMVGNYVGNMLMSMVEVSTGSEISNPVSTSYDGVAFWLNMISLLILAPVMEELLFRKCIIEAVLPYGEKTAIILSAVVFGLAHGNFFQFFYAFGVGLLMAYIYIKTGKIIYTMILHFALNLFGGAIPLLLEDWFVDFADVMENANADQLLRDLIIAGPKILFTLLYSNAMMAMAVVGIILLIRRRKQFKLDSPAMEIPKGKWFPTVFLNVGTILFFVLSMFLFASSILG